MLSQDCRLNRNAHLFRTAILTKAGTLSNLTKNLAITTSSLWTRYLPHMFTFRSILPSPPYVRT